MPNLAGSERPLPVSKPGAATFDAEHVGVLQKIAHSPLSPIQLRNEPEGAHLFGGALLP